MAKAKILQKKSPRRQKKNQNRFGRFFKKLAGKELAVWISIWFVLMSLLMLFANNLRVWWIEVQESEWIQVHAAADDISFEAWDLEEIR